MAVHCWLRAPRRRRCRRSLPPPRPHLSASTLVPCSSATGMNSTMSKQGGKVTDVFRASRSGASAGRGSKAGKAVVEAPAAAPAAVQQPAAASAQQQAEADEAFLRQFDLDTR